MSTLPDPNKARKTASKGLGLGGVVGGLLALVTVGVAATAMAGGGDSSTPSILDLIPTGPITDAEREACEQVLAMQPQPTSYKDDQGRVWTPCSDWWLAKGIPNWPGSPFPGQVPYFHKPVDVAEWLACIAGYLVYKGPLGQFVSDPALYKNEELNVEMTKRLSARRDVLRAYMMQRLGELGRPNPVTNCDPPPPNIDPVDPDPPPAPDPPPPPPPDGALEFDLENEWGGISMELRVELARIELAARIPGLARALAVKAWQAYRATEPYVSTAEAAKIAAAHPLLCWDCFNPKDGPKSKELLDENINGPNKWPKPLDYKGWAAGSYGLFDLLGATAVYAGIHTDAPASQLPLMQMPDAAAAMKRWDVQGYAASYVVRRILVSTKYKVLKPGINAPPATQDSYQTWGNIFSAYAGPDNYAKGNQASIDAKTRYLARAKEIGINLAEVAYPWPPGTTYAAPAWTAGQVWARLQDYKTREVVNIGGKGGGKVEPIQNALTDLAGGIKARIVGEGQDLLVVLHGRDANEQQLVDYVPATKARIAFLRGPMGEGDSRRWYEPTSSAPPATLGIAVQVAANNVAKALAALNLTFSPNRIFVLGYSQGASVAYELVNRNLVAGAVIVSGFLAGSVQDTLHNKVKLWAVHGADDKNITPERGEAAYLAFVGHVDTQGWTLVPGGTHALATMKPAILSTTGEMVG